MSGEDKGPHFYELIFHSLRWGQWGGNTPVLAEQLEALISGYLDDEWRGEVGEPGVEC